MPFRTETGTAFLMIDAPFSIGSYLKFTRVMSSYFAPRINWIMMSRRIVRFESELIGSLHKS